MKQTATAVGLAALLAACGGDDGADGGGGGGTTSVTLSSPLAATLTSAASGAAAGTCDSQLGTVAFAGALVVVSTAANQCSEALAGREASNATTLVLTVAKATLSGTSTTLDAGTYPLLAGLPLPDLQGNARFSLIAAERNGGPAGAGLGCTVLAAPTAVSGSVTVTAAGASGVSGSVTATLDDGTTVSGSFAAPSCGLTVSVAPASCEVTGVPDPGTCT